MPTVKQILDDSRAFVAAKLAAAATEKTALAGQDPNSLPGSEHDQKVKEEAKKNQPGVLKEPGIDPGLFNANGAKPGGETEEGHVLKAGDPPPAKVDKEPLITSDAKAEPKTGADKTADLANDLLAAVKRAQDELKKKAEAPAEKTAAKAGSKGGDISEAQAVDASKAPPPVKKEGTEPANQDLPAEGKPAPAKDKDMATHGGSMPSKSGSGTLSALELSQDVLAKIASTLLATEEGWDLVQEGLSKAAGAEAARQTMGFLKDAAQQVQAEQAFTEGYQTAGELIKQAIYLQGAEDAQKQAAAAQPAPQAAPTKEEQDFVSGYKAAEALLGQLKAAQAPKPAQPGNALIQKIATALAAASVKHAQEDGGSDTEADPGVEADPAAGAEEDPSGGAAALEEMGGAPTDEEVSPEELQQALAALVQEGQLSEEQAGQILEYVMSAEQAGGGDAEAAGAGGAGDPLAALAGGAGAAPDAGAAGAMEATASAQDLLNALAKAPAEAKK